jgi:hypothetical protein
MAIYSKGLSEDFQNDVDFEASREEMKLQQKIDSEIVELNDTLDFISPYQR